MKSYTIKLETKLGDLKIENVFEFVFAKYFLYYSTVDGNVCRIDRSNIKKAYRLINNSSKWVDIHTKNFSN